ncbi:ABC transporter substrate-binding protein [Thermococcus sp. AM4]|uniref:ABC transporter substrate-binding protein n=1 Tax=Thermococcus sp. (strain AM4) TaxID=246969 RepID=UPI0001870B77|nr:ABC transporter substrate-binding protein [Thermococcus sp. AM4]EEB73135.1 Vitamin B12 ABC transporter periplasmic B12-binding component [Thermococcus sp. AM4]
MRWSGLILSVVLLLAVVSAGCVGNSTGTSSEATAKEVTVKDFSGRSVTVKVPVQRAVVLSTSALEIIQLLNASDQVVGIPKEAQYDALLSESLKNKTVVGARLKITDWEKVLALKPDLIIDLDLKKFYNVDELLNRSASYGIPVVLLREDNLEDIPRAVSLLGELFGREKEAKAFDNYFNEQVKGVQAIASKVPANERKKVVMIQPIMGKLYLVNGNDVLAQAVRLVGANYLVNLTFNGYTPVRVPMDGEKIIASYRDADVVILLTSAITPYEKVEKLREEMLSDEAWKGIKAVGEGNVVILRADMGKDSFLRWSPRLAVGIWVIGKAIYPDYYPAWNDKAKDFLKRFYGLS